METLTFDETTTTGAGGLGGWGGWGGVFTSADVTSGAGGGLFAAHPAVQSKSEAASVVKPERTREDWVVMSSPNAHSVPAWARAPALVTELQLSTYRNGMGLFLGAGIDLVHALSMAAWVLGLPLLFWHRFPRLTTAYAIYAIAFVIVNQVSQALLGECVLTTLARAGWEHGTAAGGPGPASDAWFTVRLSEAIFHLTPSHRGIKLVTETLIFITAVGVGFRSLVVYRSRRGSGRLPA